MAFNIKSNSKNNIYAFLSVVKLSKNVFLCYSLFIGSVHNIHRHIKNILSNSKFTRNST